MMMMVTYLLTKLTHITGWK